MEIKVPEVGESVFEAVIGQWHKKDGERVSKDELLVELETDKINVELNADVDGVLSIGAQSGETVKIGAVIGEIAEGAGAAPESPPPAEKKGAAPEAAGPKAARKAAAPAAAQAKGRPAKSASGPAAPVNPAARKAAGEKGIDLATVQGSGRDGRITLDDVLAAAGANEEAAPATAAAPDPPAPAEAPAAAAQPPAGTERITRRTMAPIRRRIAERLVAVRQQTAMLTTFNEVDMSRVQALRRKHRESFAQRHGVSLGFMSFFVKACVEALKEFPEVNARIDGDDVVYQHFYDIGIAVGSERGLLVPVLRDADAMHFADIEQGIAAFVERIGQNKIDLKDLDGGTFTITNGGVYGSLLSTPILNPPQSAILGMHAIQDRPVARDGAVVIRPMMYLALSYDHRLIDGREAVRFLKRIKELIEEPEEMLLEL